MAYSDERLQEAVQLGQEDRAVEFKESIPWTGNESKLAKAIMAMTNTRDGGVIIIGVNTRDGIARSNGITVGDRRTFSLDAVTAYVNRRADPSVEVSLRDFTHEGALLLAIVVEEFHDIPVICTGGSSDRVLKPATIYVRPLSGPASTAIQKSEDLRELIELAVDKGLVAFGKRAHQAGLIAAMPPSQIDEGPGQ